MENNSEIRIDVYLWVIRIFSSRSIAIQAIKSGKVKHNDERVKPSRIVKIGDVFNINWPAKTIKIIEVIEIGDKRKNSETALKMYKDISPIIDKSQKIDKAAFNMNVVQEKGSGRPTKRNRRKLGEEGGWF